jgi:hypothetical protein
MLTPIAYGLAIVLDLAICAIGVRFLLAPRLAAAGYGVAASKPGDPAYLTVKAARDTTFGLLGLTLLAFSGARAASLFMLVATLVPLADTAIVLRHNGSRAIAFGIHFATAMALLLDAGLLLSIS